MRPPKGIPHKRKVPFIVLKIIICYYVLVCLEVFKLRHNNSVRRPSLANSKITTDKTASLSIGDSLRKAKTNLIFSRLLMGILLVLFATVIFAAVYMGYAKPIWDYLLRVVS